MSRVLEPQLSFADLELRNLGVQLDPTLRGIVDFLEDHPALVEHVRRDLERGLKNPGMGRNGISPEQTLRSLLLMRVKNWDYRELRERINDGYTFGYKPACDFIDGALRQKPMPTWKHGVVQGNLITLVNAHKGYLAAAELTVRIREGKYLVPDVAVQAKSAIQDPYPAKPIYLCIEVLSPEDRFAEVLAKCDESLAWGVPMTWIVDPDLRRAWQYSGRVPQEIPASGSLAAGGIPVSLSGLFSVLN